MLLQHRSPSRCLGMKVLVLLALVEIIPNPLAASIGSVSALDFSGKGFFNISDEIMLCLTFGNNFFQVYLHVPSLLFYMLGSVPEPFSLSVLKRFGSIFTSVYAAVQKLKKAFAKTFSLAWLTIPSWMMSISLTEVEMKYLTSRMFTRREKDGFMSKGIKQSPWESFFHLHFESASGHDASADPTAEPDP
ncbi:hypothetical protein Tco_0439758 [Tanacetum coccineum]